MFGFLFKKNKIRNLSYIPTITNLKNIRDLRNENKEKIYAIFLKKTNMGYVPLGLVEYGNGDEFGIFKETFRPMIIIDFYKKLFADAIVIVHNHPKINGKIVKAYPSKNDIKSTIECGELWQKNDCFFLDHLIVNEVDTYSFLRENLLS